MSGGLNQKKLTQVIERFWSVREQVTGPCDAGNNEKKAAILLQESEELWSYGETNKILSDQAAQAKANLVRPLP
jgi:methylaspartate ammonia-lyase